MTLGPVMLDVAGLRVTSEEKEVLRHPGSRCNPVRAQFPISGAAHRAHDRDSRSAPARLLIAVDHEGGGCSGSRRVHAHPADASARERWETDAAEARTLAEATVMSWRWSCGARSDFSFAPVLDVDFGSSSIIGDRAFSDEPA